MGVSGSSLREKRKERIMGVDQYCGPQPDNSGEY